MSNILSRKLTRRAFVKTSAALGAVAALGDHLFGGPVRTLVAGAAPAPAKDDKWVPFYCNQCGMGPDLARAHIVNGVLTKVEGDPRFKDKLPCPSLVCVKAQGLVQKVYNPYRIKAPMKRTNPKKGVDEDPKFVEISWDEALNTVTARLKEIKAKGPVNEQGVPRVALGAGSGPAPGSYQGYGWGPFWSVWGPTEKMGGGGGIKCYHGEHVYGELWRRAFVNAPDFRLCNYEILFGKNQNATTVQLGAAGFKLYADARVRGMKQVHISPDMNLTAAKADEWVPIKIKTDDAFMFAMINVVLHEMDWRTACDIAFLKKMTNSPYLIGPNGYYVRDPATRKPLVWDAVDKKARAFDDPEIKDFALEGTYPVTGIEIGPDGEISNVTEGAPSFQLLIDHVKGYTPEWASGLTDVPAATIRRIANEFVKNAMVGATVKIDGVPLPFRPVSINLGKSVNNGWGSYQSVWAQHVLLMLMGALEVPGGNLGCYSLIYMFVPVQRDADGFLLSSIAPTDKENWEWPPRTRPGIKTLTPIAGPGPSFFGADTLIWKSFVEPMEGWPASVPDAYFFWFTNPVASNYDSNLIRQGFEKIPFVVNFAYTINESNWYADLLLPEATDVESLQLAAAPSGYKGAWEYRGFALRQPVVKPLFNTRDLTDIYTELADRMGVLPAYNAAVNGTNQLRDTPWQLEPGQKYPVEDIVQRISQARTNGNFDLAWFKDNGATLQPVSKLGWYLHVTMTKQGMRYRLPYQAELRKAGEELQRRLDEAGIHWWDNQAAEYTHPLPKPEDWRAIYEEAFQAGPEYDLWLTSHRGHHLAWAHNADVPWMIEVGKDTLDVPGVVINSQTAQTKGIANGDRVCLESRFGKTYANAIVSETVRPDTLVVCEHFDSHRSPVIKDLGWPNMNEVEKLDIKLSDETGGSSDHAIVKIYKV